MAHGVRRYGGRIRTGAVVAVMAIAALFAVAGCATKTVATLPDGTVLETRAGFGNRTTFGPIAVEPAQGVVDAGERVAVAVIGRASEALLSRAVDAVTTAATVQ